MPTQLPLAPASRPVHPSVVLRAIRLSASLALVLGCGGRVETISAAGGDSATSNAGSGSASAGVSTGGTSADASAGMSGKGQEGAPCSVACPTPFVGIRLEVTEDGGGPVSGVQATLSSDGPPGTEVVVISLSCRIDAARTICVPKTGGPWGEYLIEAIAPGYQERVVAARISPPDTECGCGAAIMQPSAMSLDPQF